MNDVLRKVTEFVLFFLPASAVWLDHGVSGSTALLIVVSLYGLVLLRGEKISLGRQEKILLALFLMFSMYSLFSWWWHGMESTGVKHVGKHLRFALIIPAYLWLRLIKPRSIFLWYGVIAGAIVSIAVALYDIYISGVPRAHGSVHPILFGDTALILGFMAFAARDIFSKKSSFMRHLPLIALLSGIVASVMSGSRGAWIAIPVLFLIYAAVYWRTFNVRHKAVLVLVVFVLPVLIYLVPSTGVEKRFDEAKSDVDKYLSGKTINTSLGIRFESWKASYFMMLESPVAGVGLGRFRQEAEILVDEGVVLRGADDFNHTHNDYIYQLAVNGFIGLSLLILILFYPLKLFYHKVSSNDAEIKALSIAGMCLIVAYMQYSLSETLMVRSMPVSFYSFFIIALLAIINNRRSSIERD